MKSGIKLLELLAEADEDITNGRASPIQDTFNNLRTMLKVDKMKYKICVQIQQILVRICYMFCYNL